MLFRSVMALLLFKYKFKYNFGVYAVAYGVWRFIIEFVRDDHRGSFLGVLTPSQFWSIIMVILGIGYFFLAKYLLSRFEKHPETQAPVRQPKKKKVAAEGSVSEGQGEPLEIIEVLPEDNGGENVSVGEDAPAGTENLQADKPEDKE